MKKVTDLNAIKDITKTMLYLTPKPTEFPFIINHPIFQSPYWGEGDNLYNIMESEEGLQKARLAYEDRIDRTDTPLLLMYVCRSAYYLTFLKMTRTIGQQMILQKRFQWHGLKKKIQTEMLMCQCHYLQNGFVKQIKKPLWNWMNLKIFIFTRCI